jgi:hypothetical protein
MLGVRNIGQSLSETHMELQEDSTWLGHRGTRDGGRKAKVLGMGQKWT